MVMKKNEIISKPEKLALIIYEAILRYTEAKKAQNGEKKSKSELDFTCIVRGNGDDSFDE